MRFVLPWEREGKQHDCESVKKQSNLWWTACWDEGQQLGETSLRKMRQIGDTQVKRTEGTFQAEEQYVQRPCGGMEDGLDANSKLKLERQAAGRPYKLQE